MAIHRGIQSAIFYYLSCAPCAEARYRKDRKAEAERGRVERQLLEVTNPNAYRQASPASTNPHWQTEIAAGPHLVARGGRKRAAPKDSSDSQRGVHSLSSRASTRSAGHSSVDVNRPGSNRAHVEGSDAAELVPLPPRAVLKERLSPEAYRQYRPPQVSELHPAVVTNVASREEAAWLMEPPPVADVMTGRDRAGRVRSDSSSSRPSTRGMPLSRQLSIRTMERQFSGLSSTSLTLTRERSSSNRSGHLPPVPQERDFAAPTESTVPTHPIQDSETSTSSAATVIHQPASATATLAVHTPRKINSRPQPFTIRSESSVSPTERESAYENRWPLSRSEDDHSSENRDRIQRRPGIVVRDSSIRVLQELAPKSKLLNTQIVADTSPVAESEIGLPPPDDDEGHRLTSGPDLFDSWYTPDFQLDTWIHEHTKREVKQRWSMDI